MSDAVAQERDRYRKALEQILSDGQSKDWTDSEARGVMLASAERALAGLD